MIPLRLDAPEGAPSLKAGAGAPAALGYGGLKVRAAADADLPRLLNLARAFVAESGYGWTFDPKAALSTLGLRIAHERAAVLIVEAPPSPKASARLAGAAMMMWDRDFVAERIGYVEKFYIGRAWRGTPAARLLAQACVAWFQAHHVRAGFATATANLSAAEDGRYRNLFAKVGFAPCGDTLMRVFAPVPRSCADRRSSAEGGTAPSMACAGGRDHG